MNSKIPLRSAQPSAYLSGAPFSLSLGLRCLVVLISTTLFVACGGGGGDSSPPSVETPPPVSPPVSSPPSVETPPAVNPPVEIKFTLGGPISGLGGATGLTLVNRTETLTIAAGASSFTFTTQLTPNTAYNVTVGTQPSGLSCSVTKGSGLATVNVNTVAISCVGTRGTNLLAGNVQGDGSLANALFVDRPNDFAIDKAGTLYLIERYRIRKITQAGAVTTLAGSGFSDGFSDGVGTNARFSRLEEIDVDGAGNVYVVDMKYLTGDRLIRKITPSGGVTTLANLDTGATGFGRLVGMAVDSFGNVYIAENQELFIGLSGSGVRGTTSVRKIDSNGMVTTLTVFSGNGSSLYQLSGIAVDSANNVYVKDLTASVTRKLSSSGAFIVLTGNDLSSAPINWGGSVVDPLGNVWRSEDSNQILTKRSPAGVVLMSIGSKVADGVGNAASFSRVMSLAIDGTNNVYVRDDNRTIRKVTPTGIVTTLRPASPVAAFRNYPYVAADRAGNVFFNDGNVIFKIAQSGLVSELAGSGTQGFANGTGAAASFYNIGGIAADNAGNVYVLDQYVEKGESVQSLLIPQGKAAIRKISPSGAVVTLGGGGVQGLIDGRSNAQGFGLITGFAADGTGTVYFSDNLSSAILKVSPAGVVTTLAGSGAYGFADGPGPQASFQGGAFAGISVDDDRNVYVVDARNQAIRKISPSGMVTTVVDYGSPGVTNSAADLVRFMGTTVGSIVVDSAGTLFVGDGFSIRKIAP